METRMFRASSILLLVLVLVLAACGGQAPEPTEEAADAPTAVAEEEEAAPEEEEEAAPEEEEEAAPEEEEEAAPEEEEEDGGATGGEERNPGGYSFVVPDGWEVSLNESLPGFGAITLLIPEGGDPDDPEAAIAMSAGDPATFLDNADLGDDATLEDIFDAATATLDLDGEISDPESIEVGGLDALSASISGEDPDMGQMEGRIVVAQFDDARIFQMFGGAPVDMWDADVVQEVVDSIEFFEPEESDMGAMPDMEEPMDDTGMDEGMEEDLEDIGSGMTGADNSALGLPSSDQGTIAIGDEVSATLDSMLEAHDWTFEGTAGQIVSITAEAAEGESTDPRINLLDPDGEFLIAVDDSDTGTDAIVSGFELPVDGTYTIKIDVFGTGEYVLTLSEGEVATDEGSAEAETASEGVTLDELPIYPDSELADEEDPFVQGVTGEATAPQAEFSEVEVDVYVVEASVEFSAIEDFFSEELGDAGWEGPTAQDMPPPAEGMQQELSGWVRGNQVFIASLVTGDLVEEFTEGGSYLLLTLLTSEEEASLDDDLGDIGSGLEGPDNSALGLPADELGTVEIGGEVSATLDSMLEAHDWTFEGTAGQVITISCMAAEGESTDPRINLLDPDGEFLIANDDGGEGSNALIENYELPVDGTYTIKVDVFGTGEYMLSIEES